MLFVFNYVVSIIIVNVVVVSCWKNYIVRNYFS